MVTTRTEFARKLWGDWLWYA